MQLLFGIILAIVIAYLAYRARSLNRSGAFAAFVVGTVIFGLGGWRWAILLLTFFITSSGLSRAFKERKREANEKYAKGGQRDAGQVFGNGGIPTLFAALSVFFPDAIWPWLGFSAAFAAANADTWATELGVLSFKQPRLITNMKPVERGTSGGITVAGTLASLAGSAFIGLIAVLFWQTPPFVSWQAALLWLVLISISGLFGSLVDSVLGATVQAIYSCPQCHKETEKHPLHSCGANTHLVRGQSWLTNDWVNTFCTLSGALLIILLATAF